MQSGYPGLDLSQVIFAGAVFLIFLGFAFWAWQTQSRIRQLEKQLRDARDFRELEPEGYEEEQRVDFLSEGARLEDDEESARQRDILEHGA